MITARRHREGSARTKPKPLQVSTNTKLSGLKPKPLQVSTNTKSGGLKPKPLQISTNTIHNQPLKTPQHIKPGVKSKSEDDKDTISKKAHPSVVSSDQKKTKTFDENDVTAFVENAYDPSKHIYSFDEELYKLVSKLELADDGLPEFKSDEPFDF